MNKKIKNVYFILIILTIFFNWVFPKAGIKIEGIPLTIGIVLFVLLCFAWLLKSFKCKFSLCREMQFILITSFYFLIRILIAIINNVKISDIINYTVPLILFPFIYIIIINEVDDILKYDKIMKILTYGFIIITIYSIIQSIFGISNVDIPGLTVNLTDYLEYGNDWYMNKSNGIVESNVKIVSTYQNGNLLGVNLFIFFPIIYEYLTVKKKDKLALFTLFLFIITELLTLSRSCWIGMLIFIFLRIILSNNNTVKDLIKKILISFCTIGIIIFILIKFPAVSQRLLSIDFATFINASGRTSGAIEFLDNVYNNGNFAVNLLIGPYGFIEDKGLAYEMTELAIFKIGGLLGLILWLSTLVIIYVKLKVKDKVQKSYKIAILVWGSISIIEGAYWLPPTALNLFTMLALGMSYKSIGIKKEEVK